jgi:hypothetical protein
LGLPNSLNIGESRVRVDLNLLPLELPAGLNLTVEVLNFFEAIVKAVSFSSYALIIFLSSRR